MSCLIEQHCTNCSSLDELSSWKKILKTELPIWFDQLCLPFISYNSCSIQFQWLLTLYSSSTPLWISWESYFRQYTNIRDYLLSLVLLYSSLVPSHGDANHRPSIFLVSAIDWDENFFQNGSKVAKKPLCNPKPTGGSYPRLYSVSVLKK